MEKNIINKTPLRNKMGSLSAYNKVELLLCSVHIGLSQAMFIYNFKIFQYKGKAYRKK